MRTILVGLLLAGLSVPIFGDDDRRNNRDYRDDRAYRDYGSDRHDNGKHKGWYKKRNRDNRNNGQYGAYRNNGQYRNNDSYRNNGNYGRGGSTVDRALNNLNRISSRSFVDGHERDHFNKAMQNLQDFNNRYRQGNFETSRIDRAIDKMTHLANAQQLNPRDRQVIARDIQELRSLRSSGGRYSSDSFNRF